MSCIDRIHFYSSTECPSDETFIQLIPTDRVAFVCISSVWNTLFQRLRGQEQIRIYRGSGWGLLDRFSPYNVCNFGSGQIQIDGKIYSVVCKGDSFGVDCLRDNASMIITERLIKNAIEEIEEKKHVLSVPSRCIKCCLPIFVGIGPNNVLRHISWKLD
jgi:hypothetical protein